MISWVVKRLEDGARKRFRTIVMCTVRARSNAPPLGNSEEADRKVYEVLEDRVRELENRRFRENERPTGLEARGVKTFEGIQNGLAALREHKLGPVGQLKGVANIGKACWALRRIAWEARVDETRRLVPNIETTTIGEWLTGNSAIQAIATAIATSGGLVGIGWLYTWSYHPNYGVMDFFGVTDYITAGITSIMRNRFGLLVYTAGQVFEYMFVYISPERQRHRNPSKRSVLWDTAGVAFGHYFSMSQWFRFPTRAFAWSMLPGLLSAMFIGINKLTADRITANPKALLVILGVVLMLTGGACGLGWGDAILDCESPRAFEVRTSSRSFTDAGYRLQRGTSTLFILADKDTGRSTVIPKNNVLWFAIAGTRTRLEADTSISLWSGPRECP